MNLKKWPVKIWRQLVEWLLGPPLPPPVAPKLPEGFLGEVLIGEPRKTFVACYKVADGLAVVALAHGHKVYWQVSRQWPLDTVPHVLQDESYPLNLSEEKGIACWEIPFKMATTAADAIEIVRKWFLVADRRNYLDLWQPFQPN